MFVNLMRSNSRWLMGVISVLVGISLVWFYSARTDPDRSVSDRVGKIYDRTLTGTEVGRVDRELQTAASLGLSNLIDRDVLGRGDQLDIVVNHLVVSHQAEAMGIYPTEDEVADAEQKLAVFRGADGQFDKQKYSEFITDVLGPRGFGASQLDDLVRRDLQFGKVRDIVGAPVVVSPVEARLAYEQAYAKTNASVIRLAKTDFAVGVAEPTEDEVKKYFDDQKEQYVQPERRRIAYVKFGLNDEQQKLVGKERNTLLQPLANQAVEFLSDLLDNKGSTDFAATAAKANLPVKETPDFEQTQAASLPEESIPGFVQAAFKLRKDNPDSDVPLQTSDAFYDLHLVNVTPPRPLTLDEARPKVVAAIKAERTNAALAAKAEEVRSKVADALKAGRPFPDAAKDAGQTVQDIPAYSQVEPARAAPDASLIAETTQELGAGELSKFVVSPTGGFLVYVRSREGIDGTKFDQEKDMIASRLERQKSGFYFSEWLRVSRDASNVYLIPRGGRS